MDLCENALAGHVSPCHALNPRGAGARRQLKPAPSLAVRGYVLINSSRFRLFSLMLPMPPRPKSSLIAGVLCFAATVGGLSAAPAPVESSAILREYCFDCHGEGSKKGGVALDTPHTNPEAERKMWFSVWRNIDAELMPPSDKPRPTPEQRNQLRDWVVRSALRLDPTKPDPGRIVIRRLNREEYKSTIQDLTGVEYAVEDQFPHDDTGYGFDTIGAVLNLSPLHLEKYLAAAQTIVSQAFKSPATSTHLWLPEGPPPVEKDARSAYVRELVRGFASRAFRRPVDTATLEKLTAIALAEDSVEEGLKRAFTVVLAAPRFIFRAETQTASEKKGLSVPVDEYALASRLSYFLWSSTPDQTLLLLAASNQLRAHLPEQIQRMLNDPKSNRFVKNFVGQWLQNRDTETVPIQPRAVLGLAKGDDEEKIFNLRLRQAMRQETDLLFQHVLRENLPAVELLSAKYSFLNEALAKFYGVPDVKGQAMRRVELPEESHRQGILSHGSFLVVTSNPTRTSPVKRGQFILDNLLGTPAPPPPPNIPPLESGKHSGKLSMREMMVLHRSDALCASCHQRMDPLGLALENFNALGMYRKDVRGSAIDPSGQLITGEKFNTLEELIGVLSSSRKHDFYRCLSEKLLTYAVGRGMEAHDIPTLTSLLARLESGRGGMRDFIQAIVESAPFQNTRGEDSSVAFK